MAEHFFEASQKMLTDTLQNKLEEFLRTVTIKVEEYAKEIEIRLTNSQHIDSQFTTIIHEFGVETVDELMLYITKLYRLCGIKASRVDEEINQIFRDFFTATQHRNFR
ncbi:hypothetical protein [Flavobacterium sp.]|uniref:hypothetical protein n=1 Tax=Flavobacterium sp. TaxID=239 RepID=UPI0028BDFD34|nr:hypothetical protein [Flavobacterium sp.]